MKVIKKIDYLSMQIHSMEDVTTLEEIINSINSYKKLLYTYERALSLGVVCKFSNSGWKNRLLINAYENRVVIETDCTYRYEETRDDGYTYRMVDEVKTLENIEKEIHNYREKVKTLTNVSKIEMTQEEWSSLDIETSKVLLSLFDIEIKDTDDKNNDYDEDDI